MCFECCDCVLMKEVEQKAREEGIVPLNKLARYEAEEVKRRVNLGRDVPAVLALLPERPEKACLRMKSRMEEGSAGAMEVLPIASSQEAMVPSWNCLPLFVSPQR